MFTGINNENAGLRDEPKDFHKHHQSLPNEDLVWIAYFQIGKVKKSARASARKILAERQINKQQLDKLKKNLKASKRKEVRHNLACNKTSYGLLELLLDIFLCI